MTKMFCVAGCARIFFCVAVHFAIWFGYVRLSHNFRGKKNDEKRNNEWNKKIQ